MNKDEKFQEVVQDEKFQEVVEEEDGLPQKLKTTRLLRHAALAVAVAAVIVAGILLAVRECSKPAFWKAQGSRDRAHLNKTTRWATRRLCKAIQSPPTEGRKTPVTPKGKCGVEIRAAHRPPHWSGFHVRVLLPCRAWKKIEQTRSIASQKRLFEEIRNRFTHHYDKFHSFREIAIRVYVKGYYTFEDLVRLHKHYEGNDVDLPRLDDPEVQKKLRKPTTFEVVHPFLGDIVLRKGPSRCEPPDR